MDIKKIEAMARAEAERLACSNMAELDRIQKALVAMYLMGHEDGEATVRHGNGD